MHVEEDLFTLTVICYLKDTTKKFMLLPSKQSQLLYSSLVIALVQVAMMVCLMYAISTNENDEYGSELSHSFALFYVKFHCAIALHLFHYPEV